MIRNIISWYYYSLVLSAQVFPRLDFPDRNCPYLFWLARLMLWSFSFAYATPGQPEYFVALATVQNQHDGKCVRMNAIVYFSSESHGIHHHDCNLCFGYLMLWEDTTSMSMPG